MSLDILIRSELELAKKRDRPRIATGTESALASIRTEVTRQRRMRLVAVAAAMAVATTILATSDEIGERLIGIDRMLPPADGLPERRLDDDDRAPDEGRRRASISMTDENDAPAATAGSQQRVERVASGVPSSPTLEKVTADKVRDSEGAIRTKRQYHDQKPYSTRDMVTDATACWAARMCTHRATFQAPAAYRYVSFDIQDDEGRDVRARIYIKGRDEPVEICNRTGQPLRIPPGAMVEVSVVGVGCGDWGDDGPQPSTGTVSAYFRRG